MSILKPTKEKVNQAKTDLLANSIIEQLINGGGEYIDGFEQMYARLNKTYVPRNEYWQILTTADFSVSWKEYPDDGCYRWIPTGSIYLVTSRNELGVSFQIFDTLTSKRLSCFLEGGPVLDTNNPCPEIRRIKTRTNLSVMAYREYAYNIVVDKYTHIFTIDNSDRPFVEQLFKEGYLAEDAITRKLIHDYNYSWPLMFDTLVTTDNAPKNTVF
jgi:hypothetical protein